MSSDEPLVWVTVGKTQHPAYLLSSKGSKNEIRWASSGDVEWVDDEQIELQLSSRRRRRSSIASIDSQESASSPEKRRKSTDTENSEVRETTDCTERKPSSQPILPRRVTPEVIEILDDDTLDIEASETLDVQQDSLVETSTEDSNKPKASGNAGITFKTSAYVQNLAEICFLILNDSRWKLKSDGKPLFRWEWGDDLSVAIAFSRIYIPPTPVKISGPCNCLLCGDYTLPIKFCEDDPNLILRDAEKVSDDDSRILHLYSRLFYRKGPWFRIDDLFYKYYARRKAQDDTTSLVGEDDESPSSANNMEDFFNFRETGQKAEATDRIENDKNIIDEGLLQVNIQSACRLIQDVRQLLDRGYVRSFDSEEECGKTVGRHLLTSEERVGLLGKLGAGKSKAKGQADKAKHRTNEVWDQMSKQRSVFSVNGQSSLLPVRKHVEKLILDKLVASVVKSSKVHHFLNISSATMKRLTTQVYEALNSELPSGKSFLSAVCLREVSVRALRRVARLFLCASGGPGDMRSDETNGWKSVAGLDADAAPQNLPVSPPGTNTWSMITYPGLTHRFNLVTSPLFRNFRAKVGAFSGDDAVFAAREDLELWEQAVEMRTNLDFLLSLNETIRYDMRRRKRGLKGLSNGEELERLASSDIDFLNVMKDDDASTFLGAFRLGHCQSLRLASDLKSLLEADDTSIFDLLIMRYGVTMMALLADEEASCDIDLDARPWLRHLSWKACLAYCLWDVIPIFERNDRYDLAIEALCIVISGDRYALFGRRIDALSTTLDSNILLGKKSSLVSRRARGKALDRIVIDLQHMERKLEGPKTKHLLPAFCRGLVGKASISSAISFSSIRGLARRLKRPLSSTLGSSVCTEAIVLGLRYESDPVVENGKGKVGYIDWAPITDKAIANAVNTKETGTRCAFIGHEDDYHASEVSSLNVEELAIEYYRSGRLPEGADSGGWHGWHDEGGHLRALFRILCSPILFHSDWGCPKANDCIEDSTLILSPHQSISFDLHVGFEDHTPKSIDGEHNRIRSKGFFSRRKVIIDQFLKRLAGMSPQEVADLVYFSIERRTSFCNFSLRNDSLLEVDLGRMKTLSLIAAGCGGPLLAAAFKALFYDYRHYSGGLPDLLLVRATFADDSNLVNLGEWIGEEFGSDKGESASRLAIYADEEFLGCSKAGDSATGGVRFMSKKAKPNSRSRGVRQTSPDSESTMKDRLKLSHSDREVRVECMMVEVKSSNDRLDPRQEDWLNILDRHGNARVCKFESKQKKSKT